MRPPRAARLLAVPAFLAVALLASGCAPSTPSSDAERADATARCIAEKADSAKRAAWGRDYARSETVAVGIVEFARCGAFWQAVTSSAMRKDTARALPAYLVTYAPYRYGLYGAVLPRDISQATRTAFADLARWLDEFAVEKRSARMCTSAPEEALAKASELELPFAIATLGHRGQIASSEQATRLAQLLVDEVDSLSSRDGDIQCNDGARLRRFAEELERFVHGQHPWAPGCGIAVQDQDFRLVCTGQTSAR